jgi:hypothetical protein
MGVPGSGVEAGLPGHRLPAGDIGEAAFQAARMASTASLPSVSRSGASSVPGTVMIA